MRILTISAGLLLTAPFPAVSAEPQSVPAADAAALHLNLAQVLRKLGRVGESEDHMEAYRQLSRQHE